MISGQKPLDLLTKSLNQKVLIKLKGGRELRGLLKGYDQHMNLVLEHTEEILRSRHEGEKNRVEIKKLGTIIVRGDNVIIISPPRINIE